MTPMMIRGGLCRASMMRGISQTKHATILSTAASSSAITGADHHGDGTTSTSHRRHYASTPLRADDEDASSSPPKPTAAEAAAMQKAASKQFNAHRASYKRRVGNLRRRYLKEHREHEQQDLAAKDAAVAATTRRRLERQRAKNERSFENALRQEELRRQTQIAFEEHLEKQQKIREADHKLHQRARQLLIDELEEEAHLWLTTPEEVHEAFSNPETEQKLWSRPQGVLGVPNPSLDSHFWSFEGHTWDRSKTYKTRSELLLEDLEQQAYAKTNVDFERYWTPEKLAETERLEQKAQLRANVRAAGKRALLQRQRDYLNEEQETEEGEPPKPRPIPSLSVLGNEKAQEQEGAELLLKDPTKFFVFDGQQGGSNSTETPDDAASHYAGASLGVPVGLRDPLRTGKPQGRVFPVPVGKLPKPDLRTEKEKKRQEREERLWAAAGKSSDGLSDEDLLVAEEDREIGEAIDYEEAHANWDSDDEEWEKGLDEDADKDVLAVPREYRYRDEDLDRVIADLEAKAQAMQSHVQNTIKTMEQEARSRLDRTEDDDDEENAEPFFDAATTETLASVGADVDKYEALMASLSHEQLLALFGLEAREEPEAAEDSSDAVAPSTQLFASIEGLTEDQIEGLTELESFLKVAEQQSAGAGD